MCVMPGDEDDRPAALGAASVQVVDGVVALVVKRESTIAGNDAGVGWGQVVSVQAGQERAPW